MLLLFLVLKKITPLNKLGKFNIWINSKKYNFVENLHQFYLLMIVDILKKYTEVYQYQSIRIFLF